jgi:ABC-type glycerol-3-phosphate transport system substrate-binding protein
MADGSDFSASVSLHLHVPDSELRKIRDDVESSIGSVPVPVEGGRAGGASAVTDGGGIAALATLQEDTVDLLEEIEEDLSGGVGGGGGDGGGLLEAAIAGRAGAAAAGAGGTGLLGRLSSSGLLRAVATGGASVTGGVAAPALTRDQFQGSLDFVEQFTGTERKTPEGLDKVENKRAPLSPFNFLDAGATFFGRPDAPTDEELPGNITRETIRRNRADEKRQQTTKPEINVDVTVEQTRQALEQAVRDAKRQAAREVAQEVNKNIRGTTSRTGL